MTKLAFLGLGVMGFPMARHLVSNGNDVVVYNRTRAKAEIFSANFKTKIADSPAEAAKNADIVFACVGDDSDLKAITVSEYGAFNTMKPGRLFIDHTTTSAAIARDMSEDAKSRKIGFLDAPVSGGQAGAENGKLTIMCGGSDEMFEKARFLMSCYGTKITLMGSSGSGQLTKMVNQILCAGAIQGAAEAIAFGLKAGLDMDNVLDAVKSGAAGSWYLQNRGDTMVKDEFDFGFAVDLMHKDLNLVIDQAKLIGSETPLTTMMLNSQEQSQHDNKISRTRIGRIG